jgi:nucleotide-binding universal stress UspA family protein
MKTILVPVDFSETAANAAEFAGNLAAFYGAELWLYHAFQIPIALSEFAYPVLDIAEMQKAADHELEVLKDKTQAKLRRTIPIHLKSEMNVLQLGLDNICATINPDLVVMGLSGKNALTRLIVGSNTIKTINDLRYPLLVIPPKAEFIPVRRIGFACDYHQLEKTTPVSLLNKIVTDFHADLHVLNISTHKNNEKSIDEGNAMIMDLLKGTKAEFHNVEAREVPEGINWFIDRAKLDWIVVIPKKHRLLEKVFKRSHTQELIFHTHTPVLCIHE